MEKFDYRQPPKLCFRPSDYKKECSLGSKCTQYKTVELLKSCLSKPEQEWFSTHQFKHLWHMPTSSNRMLQGIWLLSLRKADLEDKSVCLFVVNGVPIRYSIREHGLLSGLFCHKLEENYKKYGSEDFILRLFKKDKKVDVPKVRNKLQYMTAAVGDLPASESLEYVEDRLKLGVLLFLSTVIDGQKGSGINPFILQIVDNLKVCEEFPWGTYTFEVCLENLSQLVETITETVQLKTWNFPGFIIPLEVKISYLCRLNI